MQKSNPGGSGGLDKDATCKFAGALFQCDIQRDFIWVMEATDFQDCGQCQIFSLQFKSVHFILAKVFYIGIYNSAQLWSYKYKLTVGELYRFYGQ